MLEMLRPFHPGILQIQQGQPAREQFAKDHPFVETRHDAEPDPLGERLDRDAHLFLVDHLLRADAVAQHDPVDGPLPGLARACRALQTISE